MILSVWHLLLLFALPWIVSSISALIRCGNDVRLGNWVSMDNNEEEKAIADIDNAARTTGPQLSPYRSASRSAIRNTNQILAPFIQD